MDINMMQFNYQSKYLVVVNENTYVSVYIYEKCKFDQTFLCFQAKKFFIAKSKLCSMTEVSGAMDKSNFNGNTVLLEVEDEKHVYLSGLEIFEFRTDDKIVGYISLEGNNVAPYILRLGNIILHINLL